MLTLPPLSCIFRQVAEAGSAACRGVILDKTLSDACAGLTSPVLQGKTTCVVLWAAAKTNVSPTWSWSCRWDLSAPRESNVLFAAETKISASHSIRHTSFLSQGEESGRFTQNHDWRHLLCLDHFATRQADFRGH